MGGESTLLVAEVSGQLVVRPMPREPRAPLAALGVAAKPLQAQAGACAPGPGA